MYSFIGETLFVMFVFGVYSTENKKVLEKMKDETHGIAIQEFVGLKSKMYTLIYEEEGCLKEKKTAKGIKKSVIKHHTKHEHYKQCLSDSYKKNTSNSFEGLS
jgi:hypothetical protein